MYAVEVAAPLGRHVPLAGEFAFVANVWLPIVGVILPTRDATLLPLILATVPVTEHWIYVPLPSAVPEELALKVVAVIVGVEYATTVTAELTFVVALP